MTPAQIVAALFTPLFLLYLYVRINDSKLMRLPPSVAQAFQSERWTEDDVKKEFLGMQEKSINIEGRLPQKTGRRYIVVGGAGFLGGWIVRHLIERGEDPRRVRVLDIRPPTRPDLTSGPATLVDFRAVDITDKVALDAAFDAAWPDGSTSHDETTVFHTAANIRFYERHPDLLYRSSKVNVDGTQNILDACQRTGVKILVYTSSGSVLVHRTRFLLGLFEKEPPMFTQAVDDKSPIPDRHDKTFSNYAASKIEGEKRVRNANGTGKGLRTGCIRPGNGIYGPGGDVLCGAYLVRQTNPTWIGKSLQSFIFVENVSLAHLCYEARLLESPALGGDAFCVVDRGPPATYGDVYMASTLLTDGLVTFPELSSTGMLMLAHVFEWLHLARYFTSTSSSAVTRAFGRLIPSIDGDLINLQPSLWALTAIHLVFDDSRARLPPSKGGLGYEPLWSTREGLCKLVDEHIKAGGKAEERSIAGGGVSLGFASSKAQRGVGRVVEKIDPVGVVN
ncbi:NAD-P-binding protein [Peniophora sp. CONT]|nr:NAD-P-binding protein [Peniophora sp. CONT]